MTIKRTCNILGSKLTLILLIVISLFGCQKNTKDSETNEESKTQKSTEAASPTRIADVRQTKTADWYGIYQGIIPCADCEGVKTKITLLKDNTFKSQIQYIGKSDESFIETGTIKWDENQSLIILNANDGESKQYQFNKNTLTHLDNNGQLITGDLADNYILMKNHSDPELENKIWILTELMGQKINTDIGQREITITFSSVEGIASGNNGCNLFSGSYELKDHQRYTSGPFATTLMACENMDTANQFMQVIEKGDNYTVVEGVLNINKARMATMAKFRIKE